jgi:hypothetical protein
VAHTHSIPTDVDVPASSLWRKVPLIGGAVGVVGIGLALFLLFTGGEHRDQAAYSWSFAYMYWLSIGLGSLGFVLIQHVVRAGWSTTVRRIAEASAASLPVFALLFIPIALSMHDLFPWTDASHIDAILKKKQGYLNVPFWAGRAVFYFVVWTALSWFLYARSAKQDAGGRADLTKAMWNIAPAGIILYALTQTFAAFDWLMSQQPHWYSTMWGVYYFAGSILATYAFITLAAMALQSGGMAKTAITVEHYHDLGKFIFGHRVFWGYIAFSQFFLIWYGNIPEETEFYLHRLHGGWEYVSYGMVITNFFIPFLMTLSRHVKRRKASLAFAAAYVLVVHAIDLFWVTMPNVGWHHEDHVPHLSVPLAAIAAFVGIGGVFLAVFSILLARVKVVAVGDPRLEEALAHENY